MGAIHFDNLSAQLCFEAKGENEELCFPTDEEFQNVCFVYSFQFLSLAL